MSMERRREMVDREHPTLSIVRQCSLLRVNRSSLYYRPKEASEENLLLMREMDRQYLETPFYGPRRMKAKLNRQRVQVSRKRVQRLMGLMGLQAIYRRPRTSRRAKEDGVYPYLLRNAKVREPNQVWLADITYIPMASGFLYLVAVMDWYSRYVVSWRLSNALEADLCVEALIDALERGKPDVLNTDQGSQFASQEFTQILQQHGVKISMDGKGRYQDNIFAERLWRTVKYEEVHLKTYANAVEARKELGPISSSIMTRGPTRPWDTGPRQRCSTGPMPCERRIQKKGRCSGGSVLVSCEGAKGPSLNSALILSK